ncbi:carbohydrate ABC transporter permease [Paenibacillus abyssi]|uniref:Sugar ABC transporter permease n=1 Tax=Paenibacillus abyssi TaxID=1340531 RepID=A0A917FPL3_9BACL|nr:carbohydrate ABC transporter permease [Paenibacillus abyssi]GGF93536.1 sugar ABC transporter permease [Paenibacillus abyssi]
MKSSNVKWGSILRIAFLTLWMLFILFPLYWTVITSFKVPTDIYGQPTYIPGIDFTPTTSAWTYLFGEGKDRFLMGFMNSILIGLISSFFALVIGAMAAYGLARYKYKYGPMRNDDIAFTILSQRMMPPIVAAIALFIMFRFFGLLDTKLGMIIIYTWMNIPITVFLLKDYFAGISADLEHAAAIDGYSKFDQIRKIVLPLAKPGLASAFLLSFIFAWNEFLIALILTFQDAQTFPVFISGLNAQMEPKWSIISATGVVAILPPTLIAILMDKYIVSGLLKEQK